MNLKIPILYEHSTLSSIMCRLYIEVFKKHLDFRLILYKDYNLIVY